jgi:hypothetical protein
MLKSILSVGLVTAVIAAGLSTPIDRSFWELVGYAGAGSVKIDAHTVSWAAAPANRSRSTKSVAQPTVAGSVEPHPRKNFGVFRQANHAFPRVAAGTERTGGTDALTSPRPIALKVPRLTPAMARVASNQVATQSIVRSLQGELRRVGCYSGRIDGDWGPASRFAMAAFVRRVNAALPTDEPDHVLLSLVQRHAASACAADYVASLPNRDAAKIHVSTRNWRTRVTLARPTTTKPLTSQSGATQSGARQSATMDTALIRRQRLVRRPVVLRNAPRIVRSHNPAVAGTPAKIARTNSTNAPVQINSTALSASQQPYSYGAPRMALGAPAPFAQDATVTGQAAPAARPSYRSSRRQYRSTTRRKSSRRYRKSRRANRSWRRRVTNTVNLNGS